MESVAADNPKLVHGGDRLKEIAERIKSGEARGSSPTVKEGPQNRIVTDRPVPSFTVGLLPRKSGYCPARKAKNSRRLVETTRIRATHDEPNHFRF